MSCVLGTNCGFVTVAPVDDPAGGSTMVVDSRASALFDTSPATAVRVTEIGWWLADATEAADFEVGIYTDAGNSEPEILLAGSSGPVAKGTAGGVWKVVTGLNITISPETAYWIGLQLDNTATQTNTDREYSGGADAYLDGQTALPADWGTSTGTGNDLRAYYAVWDTGGGGAVAPTGTFFGPFGGPFRGVI